MYAVVEFTAADGGGLSVVNAQWLTPRKREVYWPPIKSTPNFTKLIKAINFEIDSDWRLYGVERIFYETGK